VSNLKRLLTEALERGSSIERGMGSPSIVAIEVMGEAIGSLGGGGIGTSIGPLAKKCLDEAFGFSVGSGSIGLSAQVSKLEGLADVSEAVRDVAGAVVRHDGLDSNALALEPGHGAFQEGDRGGGSLIGQDLGISQTGSVIDGNVDELPSDAADTSRAVTVDAMADAADPTQLLDVDVDELSGVFSLVAHDGFFGIEVFESGDPVAGQDPVDRRGGESDSSCDLGGGIASSAQPENLLHPLRMGCGGHAVRSRAAIDQRRLPGLPIPFLPLRSSLATQSGRLGGAGQRHPGLNPSHQQQSTGRATSGILVKLHLGSSGGLMALDTSSLTDLDPDGQLTYVNNVLRNHS
jgi:hypothetical protein